MKTTINKIKAAWRVEAHNMRRLEILAENAEISILSILENFGFRSTIRYLNTVEGHDREIRLFAIWCARQMPDMMTDQRLLKAIDVAESFSNGKISKEELKAAQKAVYKGLWRLTHAEEVAKHVTTESAAVAAFWTCSTVSKIIAMKDTEVCSNSEIHRLRWNDSIESFIKKQTEELRRVCAAIDAGIDPYPKNGNINHA